MPRKTTKIPRKTPEEVIAESVRRELEKQQEENRKARRELFRRVLAWIVSVGGGVIVLLVGNLLLRLFGVH
jgi:hypothetical protein